jgi:hypothetical protein
MKTRIKLKKGVMYMHLAEMTPYAIIALGHYLDFCDKYRLPVMITNIKEKFPQSTSDTHPEGRAFDVSVKNWSEDRIHLCVNRLNEKLRDIGAVSARSGKIVAALYHDIGLGAHIHIQVRRK